MRAKYTPRGRVILFKVLGLFGIAMQRYHKDTEQNNVGRVAGGRAQQHTATANLKVIKL